jgi:hypothetical protein
MTEPEPVAWFTEDHREDKSATTYSKKMAGRWKEKGWPVTPLYTAPPQREWQGLTDEEMSEAMDYWSDPVRSAYGGAHSADGEYIGMIDTWRYIEAKLKEKNYDKS